MGGAMALHLAFRFVPEIAGVFALSSFLNNNSITYQVTVVSFNLIIFTLPLVLTSCHFLTGTEREEIQ